MVSLLWDQLDSLLLVALTDFSGAPFLHDPIFLTRIKCRAFRALLFLTPEDVATFPGLGSTLPYSTALHLLISRYTFHLALL